MHPTVKKYALVVFITLLVWVWANNAMEDDIDVTASITTLQTGDSDILATFGKPMPLSVKIKIKGSSSKIANLQKLMAAGQENLGFVYSPQNDLEDETEAYPLDTIQWLNQTVKIKSLGLSVETAEPAMIQVTIEKLVKKEVAIECFDEDGIPITPDSLNPSTVDVFVKSGWVGKARIELNAMEVGKAQKDYVIKEPYVQLTGNNRRYGDRVTVKLPSTELDPIPFQPRKIFFAFSENLQGKYSVKLINESDFTGVTMFKASPEAMEAYKNSAVHIIVPILDGDENKAGEIITRDVIYNFPPESFAAGKIKLAKQPGIARFELIKLPLPASP